MRKIAIITGTRAEYGYLKSLMKAVMQDKDLELIPIITGMHLLSEFGDSYKQVENDFLKTVKIPMVLPGDNLEDMASYLASGVKNFAHYFSKNRPDIVVVLGDRTEPFAAALASMYLNLPVAHINGGDVSGGTVDESIRHAITKIAHIHLAHTQENADRILKMGEDKKRIHIVGALTLDIILNKALMSKNEIFKKYDLDPTETTFLVVQHPITTLHDQGFSQMQELFSTLGNLKKQTVMLYPNCDAGGKKLIDLIEKYEHHDFMHVFKNLPHEDYLSIMKNVDLMIGNSSSAIIEAPSFKIPVINIGGRQSGRSRTDNIIDVEPDQNKIIKAIDFALNDKEFLKKVQTCKNKFGDGRSSKKIVKILKELKIDEKLIQKQITY
jgi:UDP-N-acetylglucosamine 2-epimerase (non-hydrolysing)/GDP/UDP-N,N'-diacetylbacillosamine 2-epimerase (hydrolysing)